MSSDNSQLRSFDLLSSYIREILAQPNLEKRLALFETLHDKTAPVSKPWIQFHIKRTKQKIAEQRELKKKQMELPF